LKERKESVKMEKTDEQLNREQFTQPSKKPRIEKPVVWSKPPPFPDNIIPTPVLAKALSPDQKAWIVKEIEAKTITMSEFSRRYSIAVTTLHSFKCTYSDASTKQEASTTPTPWRHPETCPWPNGDIPSLKNVLTTPEQRKWIVKELESKVISMREFSRRYHIPLSSLNSYKLQYGEQKKVNTIDGRVAWKNVRACPWPNGILPDTLRGVKLTKTQKAWIANELEAKTMSAREFTRRYQIAVTTLSDFKLTYGEDSKMPLSADEADASGARNDVLWKNPNIPWPNNVIPYPLRGTKLTPDQKKWIVEELEAKTMSARDFSRRFFIAITTLDAFKLMYGAANRVPKEELPPIQWAYPTNCPWPNCQIPTPLIARTITPDQKKWIVQELHAKSISMSEFCRRYGVAVTTLHAFKLGQKSQDKEDPPVRWAFPKSCPWPNCEIPVPLRGVLLTSEQKAWIVKELEQKSISHREFGRRFQISTTTLNSFKDKSQITATEGDTVDPSDLALLNAVQQTAQMSPNSSIGDMPINAEEDLNKYNEAANNFGLT